MLQILGKMRGSNSNMLQNTVEMAASSSKMLQIARKRTGQEIQNKIPKRFFNPQHNSRPNYSTIAFHSGEISTDA